MAAVRRDGQQITPGVHAMYVNALQHPGPGGVREGRVRTIENGADDTLSEKVGVRALSRADKIFYLSGQC